MIEPVAACLCGLDTNPVASPRMDIHCPKHDAPGGERPRAIFDAGFSQAGGESESWDREPEPCWSCGGQAEARDDIHVRCIDSRNINCEVVDHWYTRKTWNTRVSQPAGDDVREFTKHLMQRHSEVSANMPRRWCSVHKREEFKYESLEHEIDVEKARALDAAQRADNKDNPNSQPAGEPSDEEFNPWYENYEKALVAEVSSPTPADEEVARVLVGLLVPYEALLIDGESRKWIAPEVWSAIETGVQTARTALAEARRAGTPTTDERERAETIVRQYEATCFGGDRIFMREVLISQVESALSSTPSEQKE